MNVNINALTQHVDEPKEHCDVITEQPNFDMDMDDDVFLNIQF